MTGYLNKSYLIRQDECIKAEAVISNEQQSLTLARIGYLPIFVVWQCHILVCFQTWLWSGLVFVLIHHREWPCLMLILCEIVYVQQENPKTSLWVQGQFPAIPRPSWYYQARSRYSELKNSNKFLPESRADKPGNRVFLSFSSNRIQIRLLHYSEFRLGSSTTVSNLSPYLALSYWGLLNTLCVNSFSAHLALVNTEWF